MKEGWSDRTEILLSSTGVARLSGARVAVFGVGGVGGFAIEALARAGVGALDLIDSDRVSLSNINRQIIATRDSVGKYKTEAMRDRILSINPECKVTIHTLFFTSDTAHTFNFTEYDYIIDAIDSLSSKVELISRASEQGVKIISAMGAGGKLDPTRFKVADISKTSVCPLARATRIALRKRGINHLKVVYSDEPPITSVHNTPNTAGSTDEKSSVISEAQAKNCNTCAHEAYTARRAPGSVSFVPSVMGLILAGEVIKDIATPSV